MTTTQPAALPELPDVPLVRISTGSGVEWAKMYTADQMRAYALAALQSQPAAASPFNGSAAEYADRFRSAHKRATTPETRVKRRREIADAQISVLQSAIEDLRRKARETPAWERAYFSSITSLEQQVALIQSNR